LLTSEDIKKIGTATVAGRIIATGCADKTNLLIERYGAAEFVPTRGVRGTELPNVNRGDRRVGTRRKKRADKRTARQPTNN
jgi:hypothetical protein